MKRSNEKIKDFVEAQPYDQVQNHPADLPRALSAYRFTDVTSALVAGWLDSLANLPRNRGVARALAGVRGVGKSHTLAVIAALASYPDLRNSVHDVHVGTSARRLLSRRYQVVHTERGTRSTLLQELKAGFAEAIGGSENDWPDDPAAIVAIAASRIADAPLLLIIDTAFGREAHVKRDDGPFLTQLAKAAETVNVFIGLALDDDIEGADGVNASIASVFKIDYLDPEHLYRVADAHLFQKTSQSRSALLQMYVSLRESVPGFNWSEPRFASIYPVHPLVADVAAAVRLYAPSFAFLPFAAAAAAKSTNRPAQSLIAIDEVFDGCEHELRKAEELKDAFSAYDTLSVEAVGQLPIMQRLQAKLILKALFILSLDGRGGTATELVAALLLHDENPGDSTLHRTQETLSKFASAAREGAVLQAGDGSESRYRFNIQAAAGFESALASFADELSKDDALLYGLLKGTARTRFADWPLSADVSSSSERADFAVIWRGTSRFGKLAWHSSAEDEGSAHGSADGGETSDWEIIIVPPGTPPAMANRYLPKPVDGGRRHAPGIAVWEPSALTKEEKQSLRRLVALRTNSALMTEFGETARAAERTHTALAERCFMRVYIDYGALVMGDVRRPFTMEARSANSLSDMLGVMLAPMLGVRYPQHPVFSETLSESEVGALVGGLFGAANPNDAQVQALAQHFAAPLGLASLRGGGYTLEAGDQVLKQPWVRQVLAMTDAAGGDLISLDDVYRRLRAEPYGLQRESQHLILAALVAQRRVELITRTNDRITRRTLDQRMRWDDIAGIARAAALLHSSEELSGWARLLTGNEALGSIAEPGAREIVRAALWDWLNAWRAGNPVDSFSSLPDEGLTTRTWNLAAEVRRSFGTASEAIEDALNENISLEEGLQRVADAFGDSVEKFHSRAGLLGELTRFSAGIEERERARRYLFTAEPTQLAQLESARLELIEIAADVHNLLNVESVRRFELLWREFKPTYVDYYALMHESTVGASADRSALDSLLNSEMWQRFRLFSKLSFVYRGPWEEAQQLLQTALSIRCDLPVKRLLENRPYCACGFRFSRIVSIPQLVSNLEEIVRRGMQGYMQTISSWGSSLAQALIVIGEKHGDDGIRSKALRLATALKEGSEEYSPGDIDLIEEALNSGGVPPLRVELPADLEGLLTREELRARLKQWVDSLPDQPALVDFRGRDPEDAG
jgi:hypothetical protein